ncbi:histone deacetylase [Alkalimarinus sediminis]|uniref:Histone deacetylase n=1 Tax=Alkalimarinus sediminis TaxID=1632866 RepID=A0A9E8HPL8_9ALTE|nr:histone deacetylase [Alkalimarinus sediminis]UZW76786.1 histone deacetylase [Alkalimarinus sediminis]
MLPLIYHPNYSCPFPDNHRFVMSKFRRLLQRVQDRGFIVPDQSNLFTPNTADMHDLSIAHCPEYLQDLLSNSVSSKAWRRVGLEWSQGLVDRTFTAPNGTLLSAQLALKHGIACHLAGGTHHAHRDYGSGFCMINDLAYTALQLLERKEVNRILIFDCDVHQGDGTASILSDVDGAYTCSIHCEKNFPFRKSTSDLDIGLPLNMKDAAYLDVVDDTLQRVLYQLEPDIVLYDAGVDVWEHDDLGKLDITWQGIEKRDHLVLETCLSRGTPVATVIGGGYDKNHEHLAKRHSIVIEQAHALVYGDRE